MDVGVPGRGNVRGLERNSGGDIVGGRRAAGAVRGGERRVMGGLVVATRDEDRNGLTTLGASFPEGTVEDALNPGAENPPPGGHVPLNHGAIAAMDGDLPPAA